MTLEEAKQLKPGDSVFIEAKVEKDETGRTIFGNEKLLISFGAGRFRNVILANLYYIWKEEK